MPDSTDSQSASNNRNYYLLLWPLMMLLPVFIALLVYQLDSFDPAPIPLHELTQTPFTVPLRNDRMLEGAEFLGAGKLQGPEDLAYDSESRLIYTTCHDGWVKRVRLNDSVVQDFVNTNGRPLGVALGHNGELIVADPYKGLLNISKDGEVEVLTDEADGLKFKLTDGVDIADDGIIYFTDASYKYELHDNLFDVLEGRPHGRLMSFDPISRKTTVLLNNLYFANGVAVSPHQDSVIFCETSMRRCRRYYIKGNKQGQVEKFVDIPGFPDNIKYDGEGHYWIGLPMEVSTVFDLAFRYPLIRKVMLVIEKYIAGIPLGKNAGVYVVDLDGKPVAHYHDERLSMVTVGMKIENRLYCGSLTYPHIITLNLDQHPPRATV